MVQDMMRATWFRIDTHAVLTMTACGTCPGDPAADMLLALAFGEYLRSLERTLAQAGLLPALPDAAALPPWAQTPDDAILGTTMLLERTRQTISHATARATALGMKLSFAPTKTAVLLPAACDWAQHSPHVAEYDEHLCLQFDHPVTREPHAMSIVHSYRHLGGILTSNTTPRPDLLLRQSQALGFVKPLRKQLFANRITIPLKVRSTVLQALSGSRLVHSAAALVLPACHSPTSLGQSLRSGLASTVATYCCGQTTA